MTNLKVEINLNDIVEDMFCDANIDCDTGASPTRSFSDSVREEVVSSVASQIKSLISKEAIDIAKSISRKKSEEFINSELEGILTRKLRSGELKTRYGGFKSFDEIVEEKISRFDIEDLIKKHIDIKTKSFADEMRSRYDNIFAAKVVQGLSKQKMLDPNIAKLLLGDE